MISRTALLRSTVALAAVAVTAVTLSGCSAPAGSTTNTSAAKDPTSLTHALVPSQDQAGLVDTAKPLTDVLTKALKMPVTGVMSKD